MTDYRRLFDLSGKSAVVLGAASGIGKSSAEALAALGAVVLCADRDADGAEATAAGILQYGSPNGTVRCLFPLPRTRSRRRDVSTSSMSKPHSSLTRIPVA